MTDLEGVLIYDGDCPFCSAAASALRYLPAVGAVPWNHESAQNFLEAEFGETPFALVFVDRTEQRVYIGRDAAEELCDRAGVPVLARDLVADNYETLADGIRRLSSVDRDPDPYHDVVPLIDTAESKVPDLLAAADQDAVHDHLPTGGS